MTQQAAAREHPAEHPAPAGEAAQAGAPVTRPAEPGPGRKVVGLHGEFVPPDPGGPNIDLFDNVPV